MITDEQLNEWIKETDKAVGHECFSNDGHNHSSDCEMDEAVGCWVGHPFLEKDEIRDLLLEIRRLRDLTDGTISLKEATTSCPFCQHTVDGYENFCQGCGAKLYHMGSSIMNPNLGRGLTEEVSK